MSQICNLGPSFYFMPRFEKHFRNFESVKIIQNKNSGTIPSIIMARITSENLNVLWQY